MPAPEKLWVTSVKFPTSLRERIKKEARVSRRTISAQVIVILEEYYKAIDQKGVG